MFPIAMKLNTSSRMKRPWSPRRLPRWAVSINVSMQSIATACETLMPRVMGSSRGSCTSRAICPITCARDCSRKHEQSLAQVIGQIALDVQLPLDDPMTLGMSVSQAVAMLCIDTLIDTAHRGNRLGDQGLFIRLDVFDFIAIWNIRCVHERSPIHWSARRLGRKKYSPPRKVLKVSILWTRRGGLPGIVK